MKKVSTKIDKKTLIFTIVALIMCSVLSIVLLIKYKGNYLALFAAIMLIVVAISSFVVLIGMLTDKAYIENNVLYMSYIFKKSNIKLNEIGYIEFKDDVYHVYDNKNNEVGSINGLALGIDELIHELDINNVNIK